MFRRIATIVLSFVSALSVLLSSGATISAQMIIANDQIPEIVWTFIPDPYEQVKVRIQQLDPHHQMSPHGGWILSTFDGSPVTFRRQTGDTKYRIEYDALNTKVMMYMSTCLQGGQQHRGLFDPRSRKGDFKFFVCEGPADTLELVTNQIWYWPDATPR